MPERTSAETSQDLTLEELLRLKKHEQPDPSFWESFETELKARTVRELVKKPCPRERLSAAISFFLTRLLPASGAGAALLLALFLQSGSGWTSALLLESASPTLDGIQAVSQNEPGATESSFANQGSSMDTAALLAASDFAVDIISSPQADREASYKTDFLPDVLASQNTERASYTEDVISVNLASISPASFILGM